LVSGIGGGFGSGGVGVEGFGLFGMCGRLKTSESESDRHRDDLCAGGLRRRVVGWHRVDQRPVDMFCESKFATALNPLSQPNNVSAPFRVRPGNKDDWRNRNI
jgi:hypothetical protein